MFNDHIQHYLIILKQIQCQDVINWQCHLSQVDNKSAPPTTSKDRSFKTMDRSSKTKNQSLKNKDRSFILIIKHAKFLRIDPSICKKIENKSSWI